MERLFFGYAEQDSNARECIQAAAEKLSSYPAVEESTTWEDLRVDGKVIINDIVRGISHSTIAVFDISSMNPNVLFELGVAIGAGKSVCILRDSDNTTSEKLFKEFALLTTTGFTGYTNSVGLLDALSTLVADPPKPLLDELLGDVDNPIRDGRLLYVPSMKEDEASRKLSRLLDAHSNLEIERVDLDEHGTSPLAWLVQEVYSSPFSLFHFTPSDAYLAQTSNRRCALLAGVSLGLGRQIRLAMHSGDPVALDYRDLRIPYTASKQLVDKTQLWLGGLHSKESTVAKPKKYLPAELAALRFGNHVAEADQNGLEAYFVETRDFLDVTEGVVSVFTGRKGTGKTATMLHAASTLQRDPRNVVVVIKPASYELEALCELMKTIHVAHIGTYLLEGIWKYLLYTELASSYVREVEASPAGILNGSPVDDLRKILEKNYHGGEASFSSRLEQLLTNFHFDLDDIAQNKGIEAARSEIGRILYGTLIKDLRRLTLNALKGKRRVAILIDNLDKAWERGADLDTMSSVIFGLLTAVGRLSDEFNRESRSDARELQITLTAFLRSDIYAYVHDRAREPDKIPVAEIEWRDQDLLARVLEDRFVASRNGKSSPEDLWSNFFEREIRGMPSKQYILSRVQPRPRDLIFLANAAVVEASNARHPVIGTADIEKAELAYSQFSYEALLVEGVAVGIDMESLLLCFVGEPARLSMSQVVELIEMQDDVDRASIDYVRILRQHGFLGIRVSSDSFDYGGTRGEMKRADVLASKLEKSSNCERMFEIHPAYRKHLAIREV